MSNELAFIGHGDESSATDRTALRNYLSAKQGYSEVGILGDKETGRAWRNSPLVDVSGVWERQSQTLD